MLIEYIWAEDPNQTKVYDTKKAYLRMSMSPVLRYEGSQEEFDKSELSKLQRDKENGRILDYKIIK